MIKGTATQDILLKKTLNPKKIQLAIAAGLLFCLALAYAFPRFTQLARADLVVAEGSLRLSTVRRGDLLREIVAQGRVVAANSPTLFSPEQGFVDLKVNAGDSVKKEQLLAVTISPELNELLAQESANLARIQTEFERQKIQTKRRKLELQQVEDLSKVNLKAMDREKRRADEAMKTQLISKLDYEKAQDDLEKAVLEYKQAKQNNALEQEMLDFELQTLQLEVESQQLTVNSLQRRVDALKITSPVDGMVGNVQVQQRQAVSVNQALITVVDLTAFEIEATVPEGYADDLSPLMTAEIKLNENTYPGELTAISPEVVNNQVVTRIRFTGTSPENLRQNQRLTARIFLENKQDVLIVDRGPFVDSFDGTVFKKEGNKAIRVPVVLGSMTPRYVEILDGLSPSEVIITSAVPSTTKSTQELLITN